MFDMNGLAGQGAIMSRKPLGLGAIVRQFPWLVLGTTLLVVLENGLLALLPLFIGFAIDDLLAGGHWQLLTVGGLLVGLTLVMVARRFYDTRAYGSIRVALGIAVDDKHRRQPVSLRTARLDMARELVDFLEEELPQLLTGIIQIVVTLVVLASFDSYLALSAVSLTVAMAALYGLFSKRFFRLNALLNNRMERQVHSLERGPLRVLQHLAALRRCEVRLSDTEALLYGLIFLMVSAFVVCNLWLCTHMAGLTSGKIFSIVSYSWEYVEAALVLPMSLQSLSRLQEISGRLNRDGTNDQTDDMTATNSQLPPPISD